MGQFIEICWKNPDICYTKNCELRWKSWHLLYEKLQTAHARTHFQFLVSCWNQWVKLILGGSFNNVGVSNKIGKTVHWTLISWCTIVKMIWAYPSGVEHLKTSGFFWTTSPASLIIWFLKVNIFVFNPNLTGGPSIYMCNYDLNLQFSWRVYANIHESSKFDVYPKSIVLVFL